MYKIQISNHVIKQIDALPYAVYMKIYEKLKTLSLNPRPIGCLKLTNTDGYRIRAGKYRILYEILDETKLVTIYDILHRKDAYRKR